MRCVAELRTAANDAVQPRFPHKEVVGFFGKHELTGSGQWIEAGFRKTRKLVLPIAICEVREREEA